MKLPMPAARTLKKGYVIGALIALFVGFGIEYAGPKLPAFSSLLPSEEEMIRQAESAIDARAEEDDDDDLEPGSTRIREAKADAREQIRRASPPGYGLEADGLYLWTVFFSILVSLIGMVFAREAVQRGGMWATLVSSIVVIGLSIVLIVTAIIEITIMITLFTTPPFGTIIYFAIYATFPKGLVLGLAGFGLVAKIIATAFLWVGGTQLVRVRSAVLLLLTGYITFLIIELVLGFVPGVFASIADAIIGIIIAIVAIVWNIKVFVGSIRGLGSGLS